MQTKVAIIGMGYVGAVTAAGLARRGCHVVGVECNAVKLDLLQRGQSPVREPGLDDAIRAAFRAERFDATSDLPAAVRFADVIMIAVGTPGNAAGNADLTALDRVVAEVVEALDGDARERVLMIRSTVPPGTTQRRIEPFIARSRVRLAVCHHPEFLREGSALADFAHPPMIVYGCSERHARAAAGAIEAIYRGITAPRLALSPAESELMKYACNLFHAVKIDFANEVGTLASAVGADPARVMAAFCQDHKLNIAPAYLRPGFAFGGSCLPKDARALVALSREHGLDLPLAAAVMESNAAHLSRQVQRVLAHGRHKTLLVGLTFKPGTDDLRESPMVELAERLLGKGLPLTIHDPDLTLPSDGTGVPSPARLLGANARYVAAHLPHLGELLREDLAQAAAEVRTIVIAKPVSGIDSLDLAGKNVVDLTCLADSASIDQTEAGKMSKKFPGLAPAAVAA